MPYSKRQLQAQQAISKCWKPNDLSILDSTSQEPHNDNDNSEDVMHQTNIENLDVHVSNRSQRYLGNSARTIRRKNAILRETAKNMAENKTNAANKKDLEKGTKARIEAVQQYIRYLINDYQSTKASEIVQQGLGWKSWSARLIRSWATQWIRNKNIPVSKRDKHPKIRKLLSDEDVTLQILSYIRTLPKNEYLTIKKLHYYINTTVLPSLGCDIENK
ncbi:14062_t:CDS:2, partial [Acaulospora morrowiae]